MDKWQCTARVNRLNDDNGSVCGLPTKGETGLCFSHWKAREIAKRGGPEDWIRLPNARDRNTI